MEARHGTLLRGCLGRVATRTTCECDWNAAITAGDLFSAGEICYLLFSTGEGNGGDACRGAAWIWRGVHMSGLDAVGGASVSLVLLCCAGW